LSLNYSSKLQRYLFHNSPSFVRNLAASLYGWTQRRQRFGGNFERYLEFLRRSQWFTREQLEEYQLQQMKAFLLHAERHCRYYHRLFQECGFMPGAMNSLSELKVLPVQNKNTLRDNMHDILPDNLACFNPRFSHTSGSTGQGLRTATSIDCFHWDWAFRILAESWAGIQPGMKCAVCSGHPVTQFDRKKPPFWVHYYTNKWLLMSSYHLSEAYLPDYIRILQQFKPDLLSGYPSSIYLLALANQHSGRPVQPRSIITSSETLFDQQRSAIESSFRCKVFDYYGNGENCAHIAQCDYGGHHLKLEYSYVEILDEDNKDTEPGSQGRLVATAFLNYAMPLIRYDVGDITIVSETNRCSCGRGGILVDRVVGRVEDYIVTSDGRFIGRLDHLFKDANHVRMAQIFQAEIKEIIIRIVRGPGYTDREKKLILNEARARLGPELTIHIQYVDDIPRAKNGKHRFIVSEVINKKIFAEAAAAVE